MRLLFSALALCAAPSLFAQSVATAHQTLRLQTYALASTVQPAFGVNQRNFGVTAGVDVGTFRISPRIDPSLDLRLLASHGNVSNQFFYGGGPRVMVDLGRYKPYGEFLIGDGIIHFPNTRDPNYTHDNSLVTAFGGGLDVSVHRDFAVRAEALTQSWKLGSTNQAFHPLAVSVGIRYQVHLGRGKDGPDL